MSIFLSLGHDVSTRLTPWRFAGNLYSLIPPEQNIRGAERAETTVAFDYGPVNHVVSGRIGRVNLSWGIVQCYLPLAACHTRQGNTSPKSNKNNP